MPFGLGAPEMIIILVIVIIIFGVGRLPEVGGAIGKGLREFRKAQKEDTEPKPPAPEHPTTGTSGKDHPETKH